MRANRIRIVSGAAVLLAGIVLTGAGGRSHGKHEKAPANPAEYAPATPAPISVLPGIQNFAEVSPSLFRGAQPDPRGFQELKNLGVAIDVNLRAEREQGEQEKRTVEALGMRYVGIPWSSFHQPQDKQVAEFLQLLQANPEKKIFVHCREGRDRTGVMMAVFRIADQHWPAEAAEREMQAFHFHNFWLHSWKRYVEKFPGEFASDPNFAPLRTAEPASSP